MNFTAYIRSQKMRIRAERAGEIDLITSDGQTYTVYDGVYVVRDSEELLRELDSLRGLNTRERAFYAGVKREVAFSAA